MRCFASKKTIEPLARARASGVVNVRRPQSTRLGHVVIICTKDTSLIATT